MDNKYTIQFTHTFKKAYQKLSPDIHGLADQKIKMLTVDYKHPSLRFKPNHSWSKFLETKAYEISVNMNFRIILTFEEGKVILLHMIVSHNIVDKI